MKKNVDESIVGSAAAFIQEEQTMDESTNSKNSDGKFYEYDYFRQIEECGRRYMTNKTVGVMLWVNLKRITPLSLSICFSKCMLYSICEWGKLGFWYSLLEEHIVLDIVRVLIHRRLDHFRCYFQTVIHNTDHRGLSDSPLSTINEHQLMLRSSNCLCLLVNH